MVKTKQITAAALMSGYLKGYRKQYFPMAPEITQDNIQVLNDEDSFLVQSADIMGNFSTALSFNILGKSSATNDLKAKIFNSVWGDLIDTTEIKKNLEIDGEDLVLKHNGSFTLTIT